MKKITGKVVSLVLALALVVSSFSANFAFASKRTISGLVTDTNKDELYLVDGDKKEVDLKDWLIGDNLDIETKDHEDVSNIKIAAVSHSSGDRLVSTSIDKDDDEAELRLKSKTGKEVLSVLYEGEYSDDDYDYTVKARQELTVYVYDEGDIVFGEAGDPAPGEGLDEFETFAKNKGAEKDIGIYKAVQSSTSGDAKASFKPVYLTDKKDEINLDDLQYNGRTLTDEEKKNVYFYEMTSGDKDVHVDGFGEGTLTEKADVSVDVSEKAITVSGDKDLLTADAVAKAITDDTEGAAKLVTATVEEGKGTTTLETAEAVSLAGGVDAVVDETTGDETTPAVASKLTLNEALTLTAVTAGVDGNGITVEIKVVDPTTNTVTNTAIPSVLHATIGKDLDDANKADDASTGNVTINIKKLVDDEKQDGVQLYKASSDSDDKFSLKTKIEKKIDVEYVKGYTADKNVDIEKKDSSTYLTGFTSDVKVKDCEVEFPEGFKGQVNIKEDADVKAITGTVKNVYVGDADVDYIDLDNGDVEVADGKVGNITTADDDDASTQTGAVVVTDGTVGNIDTTDVDADGKGKVEINGGTVGDINSDDSVTIKSDDDEEPVSVGAVTAPEIDAFADDAALNIKGIKANDNNGTFKLRGEKLTVGSIDLDYYDTTLQLGEDDDEFIGTIPAPANAEDATIELNGEDNEVKVNGSVDVDTISVDTDSKVAFNSKVTVGSVDGDGEMKINAGDLYVKEGASSVTLKLADTALAAGQTVFKCDEDAVDEDDFECFGFTLEKSEGNDIDTFKIKSLSFAGPAINKTSSKIAKGYSETFTASAYPAGTALPAGATIKWELDGGSTDVFKLTTEGNTAKVEVVSLDADFASENHTILKAYLYDEDGDEMDDYDAAECEITALAVPEAVSDTTSNFSLAQGSSYQFKITSATQPSFAVGTAGVFNSELVAKNGNDYFYKITATGKPGQEAGIYLNGNKLLVASVKAPAFKCDTTMKTTVKGSYTIKVTADKAPSFAVGTAGVFKAEFVSNKGNDYFYKITSTGKKGAEAGIYVNGVKAFVAVVG